MKKMKFYLSVLFVGFLTIQSYGQIESVNTEPKLSGEEVNKANNKDTVEIKYSDITGPEKEMAQKVRGGIEPSAISITIWIIMSWSFFLILISIPFYFNHKKLKERTLIINNLIEKGHEIPKELIARPSNHYRSDFHKGIILIALGASVVIVLLAINEENFWTIGLIPMFIGIAYLISFKYDKKNKMRSEID